MVIAASFLIMMRQSFWSAQFVLLTDFMKSSKGVAEATDKIEEVQGKVLEGFESISVSTQENAPERKKFPQIMKKFWRRWTHSKDYQHFEK